MNVKRHLINFEDISRDKNHRTFGFLERRDVDGVVLVEAWVDASSEKELVPLTHILHCSEGFRVCGPGGYGKDIRIWSGIPTEQEMKEMPWLGN